MKKPIRQRRLFLAAALGLLIGLTGCGKPERPTISLYLAVERGDIDQLERHLYWGSPVDRPFPNGRQPLHEAAAKGRAVMVKMLLKHGVPVDARDGEGRTPLELAILNGRTQVADLLIHAGARFDPSALLLEAARQNVTDRDVVRYLRRKGANLETRDAGGNTPLLIATARGNHRLAHHLIQEGADVNARNTAGETALSIARRLGQPELERLLRNNGAVE